MPALRCDTSSMHAQVDGIADWPVQLGPEFIHGAKSSLKVCGHCALSAHCKKDRILAHLLCTVRATTSAPSIALQ